MGRSRLSEEQSVDADFTTEFELTTVSGILHDHTVTVSGILQDQIDIYKYHGNLFELDQDHHQVYVPRDGSRGFTSTVSGIDPTEYYHLTTKQYVDFAITTISGILEGQFSPSYNYESLDEEESTTSEDWINRMTLTVSGIDPGQYRLAWYWEWRISRTNRTHSVRITVNDDHVNLLAAVDASMIQTTNWLSTAGFYHTTLSGEVYNIDMDWMIDNNTGGTTGYIRRTRLEFWKVGD